MESATPSFFEDSEQELLPDLAGLAPLRTLDQLRENAPREKLSPEAALKRFWGYDEFRPLQRDAIGAALAGQDSLLVLPTGGGKSLCFQVPAACGAGLVLVVSPLIALMDDQVAAAREAGLRAGALHTNAGEDERRRIFSQLNNGQLDLLYLSPERLSVGDLLKSVADRLALIAVDEAHCVSHWGHDFRPEYRQLAPLFATCPKTPRMALTATATPAVQDDICAQLKLRNPKRMVGHVDRPNLIFRCQQRAEQTPQILAVIDRHQGDGGIVYAQTRKDVERLAESLRKKGVQCAAYHAGIPAERRAQVQADFVNERLDVVVATIAFGMGIDRSNVRYVVHANAPKSIEHYQQEAGRAGRDGDPAECVLLFSVGDLVTHRYLAGLDQPAPERLKMVEQQLREIGRFAVTPVCRHRQLTEHFGQRYPAGDVAGARERGSEGARVPGIAGPAPGIDTDPASGGCGACDVCLGETSELPQADALQTAQKIISAVWRLNGRCGAAYVVAVLRGHASDAKQQARIDREGHSALTVWGLLKDHEEFAVRSWIDQLIVQGYLQVVEDGDYSLLALTERSKPLCRGDGAVRLGLPQAPKRGTGTTTRGGRSSTTKAATAKLPDKDQVLYDRLRQLRRLLAEKHQVAPYMIFHDATLHALAANQPQSLEGLRGIKGIGEAKLAQYGATFLKVLHGMDPLVAAG